MSGQYPKAGKCSTSICVKVWDEHSDIYHYEVEDLDDVVALRSVDHDADAPPRGVDLPRDVDFLRVLAGALLQVADHIERLDAV